LVRYDDDGRIVLVGRKDDGQIRLRGQRVECSEAEYQLRTCLSEAIEVVVSVVETAGKIALAAFFRLGASVSNSSVALTENTSADPVHVVASPTELTKFRLLTQGLEKKLLGILPSYMVSSLFIPISKILLSLSSKIYRKKLRQVASGLSFEQLARFREVKAAKVLPSTPIQLRLVSLWQKLLKASDLGADDNFFQAGGDSITVMRLVAAARKEKMVLTVDAIFRNPTLLEMVAVVQADPDDEAIPSPFSLIANAVPLIEEAAAQCSLNSNKIENMYPSTPQQNFWVQVGSERHEHQAQIVSLMPGSLDVEKFKMAWDDVTQSHSHIPSFELVLFRLPREFSISSSSLA
jgi:aryl carrier-like protein